MHKQLVKLFFIVVLAIGLQIGANNLAYMERGYEATGSEVFIFPMVMYGGYKICFREEELDA